MLVDTNGLILHVLVHEANIPDYYGGKLLLAPLAERFPRLELIWTDSGYTKGGFAEWVKETLGWRVEVVKHPWTGIRAVWVKEGQVIDWEKIRPRGFHVLKRRWVVERTFSWIGRYRRMSKDYEYKMSSSESMVCLTMIRLLVKRLARTAEAASAKGRLLHAA
jgi:putative transposase